MCVPFAMRVFKIIPALHWQFAVFDMCSQTILRVLKIIPVLHWQFVAFGVCVFADHPVGIKNNTRAMWLEFNFDVCTLCYAGI